MNTRHVRFFTALALTTGAVPTVYADEYLQSYGRFRYDSLGGRMRSAGEPSSPVLTSEVRFTARFDGDEDISLQFGSSYLWSTGTQLRPFVAATLGAMRLDASAATLSVTGPQGGFDLTNLRFTRAGNDFSQSVETSLEDDLDANPGVRPSVDADYLGAAHSANEPTLADFGFDAAHESKSRWAFPVVVAATYHFD